MFKNVYFYRARLFPAVLTSIPMLIFVNKILAPKYDVALKNLYDVLPIVASLGLSAAVVFLCVQVNRLIAKEIFQRFYFREELYMPTTNHLLCQNGYYDATIKTKIRDKILEKFGISLLSEQEEMQDQNRARKIIMTGVSQIRNALRGNSMLYQHNIEYGFWRNLIGGCVLAIVFSVIICLYGATKHLNDLKTIGIIMLIVYLLPVVFSKPLINYFGRYYSKILYEQFLSL